MEWLANLFTGIDAKCLAIILMLTIAATLAILKWLVLPQMRQLSEERDYWRGIGVPAVQALKATSAVVLESANGGS